MFQNTLQNALFILQIAYGLFVGYKIVFHLITTIVATPTKPAALVASHAVSLAISTIFLMLFPARPLIITYHCLFLGYSVATRLFAAIVSLPKDKRATAIVSGLIAVTLSTICLLLFPAVIYKLFNTCLS